MDYEKAWEELKETLEKIKESDDDSFSIIAHHILTLMSKIQERNIDQ